MLELVNETKLTPQFCHSARVHVGAQVRMPSRSPEKKPPASPPKAAEDCVEVVITNVLAEVRNSWAESAGRRAGPAHYQFGDLTRTFVHRVSGGSDAARESEGGGEVARTRIAVAVKSPWAKRLWDEAPLCEHLRRAGCRQHCAGMSYEIDAAALFPDATARDVRACLAHAGAVNGRATARRDAIRSLKRDETNLSGESAVGSAGR